LIGELHERTIPGMWLSDGKVIADPFVATADVVALLIDSIERSRALARAPTDVRARS
jgi:hypothetical protein